MHLFISYAHTDKRRIQELVEILRSGGHTPWFDVGLVVGKDWRDQLLTEIKRCDAFVYALSPDSVKSEWCQWEFARAIELGKPIIPVMIAPNTTLPKALEHLQYVDFSRGATGQAAARLMGGLSSITHTISPSQAPIAPVNPAGTPPQAQMGLSSGSPRSRKIPWEAIAIIVAAFITGIFGLIATQNNGSGGSPTPVIPLAMTAVISVPSSSPTDIPLISTPTESPTAIVPTESPVMPSESPTNEPPTATLSPTLTPTWTPSYTSSPTFTATATETPTSTSNYTDTPSPVSTNAVAVTTSDCPDSSGVEMAFIPQSSFFMGLTDTQAGPSNARPGREVTVGAFCIDIYEVTNAAHAACVNEGICTAPRRTDAEVYGQDYYMNNSLLPVVNVTWQQAQTFCEYRDGRLPTEAEWELAARYDPATDTSRNYPWGAASAEGDPTTNSDDRANFDNVVIKQGGQHPSGVNPFGIYDLSGNVAEWVYDWFVPYDRTQTENPLGASTGTLRVVRGGSYADNSDTIRGDYRGSQSPNVENNRTGFRCVIPQ